MATFHNEWLQLKPTRRHKWNWLTITPFLLQFEIDSAAIGGWWSFQFVLLGLGFYITGRNHDGDLH
jgi:hypothetical protein